MLCCVGVGYGSELAAREGREGRSRKGGGSVGHTWEQHDELQLRQRVLHRRKRQRQRDRDLVVRDRKHHRQGLQSHAVPLEGEYPTTERGRPSIGGREALDFGGHTGVDEDRRG